MEHLSTREVMVSVIKNKYGLKSLDVLSVMLQIPRHEFTPKKYSDIAYSDEPIPIGYGQTMSQPYTVAFMTSLVVGSRLQVVGPKYEKTLIGTPLDSLQHQMGRANSKSSLFNKINIYFKGGRVLEVGTGSGYQAAVLSKFFKEVYTVEIIPELAQKAGKTLKELGFDNVFVKEGSGEWGWKGKAPFDAIMVTAGVGEKVPEELFEQLKEGGVLVAPVGKGKNKTMTRFTKLKNEKTERLKKEQFGTFRFVPFVEGI